MVNASQSSQLKVILHLNEKSPSILLQSFSFEIIVIIWFLIFISISNEMFLIRRALSLFY